MKNDSYGSGPADPRSSEYLKVFRAMVAVIGAAASLQAGAADETISSDTMLTSDRTVSGVLRLAPCVTVDLNGHTFTAEGVALDSNDLTSPGTSFQETLRFAGCDMNTIEYEDTGYYEHQVPPTWWIDNSGFATLGEWRMAHGGECCSVPVNAEVAE